ncbi:MAG: endonuclease/exonuclease/phosphatase family protein [Clostridia bacterium]
MKKKLIVAIMLVTAMSLCFVGCGNTQLETIPPEEMLTLTENKFEKTTADEVRVMSSNVLVDIKSWGGEPVPNRANRLAIAVKQFMPDVIGAQEFNKSWYKLFPSMIEDVGYQIIKEKYSAFTENRSLIIYNTNTVNLIEHGIHKYSKGDNNGCRTASWAVFEKKSNNKKFAVISTHFDFVTKSIANEKLKIMNTQKEELVAQGKTITDKHKCPLFVVGDFNCMEKREKYQQTEYYGAVSEEVAASSIYDGLCLEYTDAKYTPNLKTLDVGGGLLENGAWSSPTWDHIFFKGDASVTSFAILSSVYFQRYADNKDRVSDHLPIFADFLLK